MRKRKTAFGKLMGFTLIELLVVIGVLGILVAVLLPVFASARRRGQQSACVNNLHQLQIACSLYSQDNGGLLPPYPSRATGLQDTPAQTCVEESALLLASLQPYVHSKDVWRCPSDHYHPDAGVTSCGLPIPNLTSYDYRGFRYVPRDYSNSRVGPSGYPLLEDAWTCSEDSYFYIQYNHGGRWNHVFLDGHAASFGIDCSNSPMVTYTP
jgi:prepilin-type N-terminal cleavage/methylation domain-containing protein